MHIRFDGLDSACNAKLLLKCLNYRVEHISAYDYAVAKSQDTIAVDDYEGQVLLCCMVQPFQAMSQHGALQLLGDAVYRLATKYGVVRNMAYVDTIFPLQLIRFRIEFMSIDAANRMIASLEDEPLVSGSSNGVSTHVQKLTVDH